MTEWLLSLNRVHYFKKSTEIGGFLQSGLQKLVTFLRGFLFQAFSPNYLIWNTHSGPGVSVLELTSTEQQETSSMKWRLSFSVDSMMKGLNQAMYVT